VTAVDIDEPLVAALEDRAHGLDLTADVGDARRMPPGGDFGLIALPMQVIQLLGGPGERRSALAAARARLGPRGVVAIAIVEGVPEGGGEAQPVPDVAEVDGWVYSSLPLDITDEGDTMLVTRLRQVVSPAGELTEALDETRLAVLTADGLEDEARACGLRATGRRDVATTEAHVGSTVVLLEADPS
jgi:hypothetical protein